MKQQNWNKGEFEAGEKTKDAINRTPYQKHQKTYHKRYHKGKS